jgi:putative transposase
VESWRHRWPVEMLCRVMQVSQRGYRSWRSRPISRRDRTDMKVLAHIREQYRLSLGSYGRPRMTMELKEVGLDVGERRVGRLMKINGSVGGDSAGGTIQSRARFALANTR